MRYYVHGGGRSGSASWSLQDPAHAFADHSSTFVTADKAVLVAEQAPTVPFTLVASSLGAVVAALAMRDHGLAPERVVWCEPAFYDIARGHPAVEGHVGPMTRARALLAEGDLLGYWGIVKPLMFGADVQWPADRPVAQRFSQVEPPWGHDLDPSALARHALVITGAWNAEYDAIADVLTDHGARRVVLDGAGHRVQDHPGFEPAVAAFEATPLDRG